MDEKLKSCVDRDAEGIKCSCGGYAERTYDVTAAEERRYGCGRPECCSRAFKCCVCGKRLVGAAAAPEIEAIDWYGQSGDN